jgi:hypothetical protein
MKVVERLSDNLSCLLKQAEEAWIAVAMISDSGLDFLNQNLDPNTKCNFLVGIDLQTSPAALKYLQDAYGQSARIYYSPTGLFHPKVYMVRTLDGQYHSIVGSGNCTQRGLYSNTEIGLLCRDQEANEYLLTWFKTCYSSASGINDDFLDAYTALVDKSSGKEDEKIDEMSLAQVTRFLKPIISDPLDKVDFTDQYFLRKHFDAFRKGKRLESESTPKVISERKEARNRLEELFFMIEKEIKKGRVLDLHSHSHQDHKLSGVEHTPYTANEIGGVWLHFGRKSKELKELSLYENIEHGIKDPKRLQENRPIDFGRLEVILMNHAVGIWARVAKSNGCLFERKEINKKLKYYPVYREKLYSLISQLPEEYFVRINDESRGVKTFSDMDKLAEFIIEDQVKYYFIIGLDISAGDKRISNKNILDTVMKAFCQLYPIYDHLRVRLE